MTRPFATHTTLPSVATGYPLNERRPWVGLVVPEATTNLWLNPSFETGTANVTVTSNGAGGGLARSSAQQCRGAYSAALTIGTGGTFVQAVGPAVTVGVTYALSAHVRAPGGRPLRAADALAVTNGATGPWARREYVGNGWWRCWVVFRATATTAPGVRVVGTPGQVFYLDAVQLEAKGYVTTYCDGDEQGLLPFESPAPFRWDGTPHASTSTRSAATRAGGRVRGLDAYGLTLVSLQGLGAGPVTNVATPLGNADGSVYQTTERDARVFTLGGRFQASGPGLLARHRGALRVDLAADKTGVAQPVRLVLQKYDGDEAIGDQVYADCSYAGGLEGNDASRYAEDVAIQFEQWQPALQRVASWGQALAGFTSEGGVQNGLVERLDTGRYRLPSSVGGAGTPTCLLYARDGTLYAGFSAAGTFGFIARWNGSAWSAMGTGLNAQPDAIIEAPDGSLYVLGNFTSAGGVANTTYAARWTGSAWQALSTGLNGRARAGALRRDGTLIVVGDFTTAGGAAAVRFTAYSPVSGLWSGGVAPFSTGLNATGRAVAVDLSDDTIYVGGDFTTADGVAANRVARLAGATFAPLGAGMDNSVNALVVGPDTYLYAGGAFTTAGGVSASRIARWNRSQWAPLGAGVGTVNALAFDLAGLLWVVGTGFAVSSGSSLNAFRWNGSAYLLVDVLITSGNIAAVAVARDGRVALGGGFGGSTAFSAEQVTPRGETTLTPYVVRLTGVGQTPYLLSNGREVYSADGYATAATEVLTIRGGDGPTLLSSIIGDRVYGVRDGSAVAALQAAPDDTVRVLVALAGGASVDAAIYAYPRLLSLDDATPRTPR